MYLNFADLMDVLAAEMRSEPTPRQTIFVFVLIIG